jgi:hypothetical protein
VQVSSAAARLAESLINKSCTMTMNFSLRRHRNGVLDWTYRKSSVGWIAVGTNKKLCAMFLLLQVFSITFFKMRTVKDLQSNLPRDSFPTRCIQKECTTGMCTATRARCFFDVISLDADSTISELWHGTNLSMFPGSNKSLPSMIKEADCVGHIIYGASVGAERDVAVVEMGTWLGATSVCIAAGLALAQAKPSVPYHAFDFFKLKDPKRDSNFKKLFIAKGVPEIDRIIESKDHGYEDVWNQVTSQVYPQELLHSHAGSIGTKVANDSSGWDDKPVALFLIDSAKDYEALVCQSHAVWTKLRPGSVVLFMDFLYAIDCRMGKRLSVPGFVYSSLVEKGLFKLLAASPTSSTVAFEVTEDYDPERGLEYLNSYHKDSDWNTLMEKYSKELKAHFRNPHIADMRVHNLKELIQCDMDSTSREKPNVNFTRYSC